MIKLNLTTTNLAQVQIKDYLENNVSETLADKINNGVQIIKENKTLLNKKDLDGFWRFATEEARKNAEKGANGAYIEDETVFGWAIHYFEEDAIEGKLYNEDGSEYKVQPKPTPKVEIKTQPKKPDNKQTTLFDLFDIDKQNTDKKEEKDTEEYSLPNLVDEEKTKESEESLKDDDEWNEEEIEEALKEIDKEFVTVNNQVVNTTTGEIITPKVEIEKPIDKELAIMLSCILENKLEIRL